MTRRIHVLPDRLANQIAAGEVVERPASVVKELLENALDAGARRVEIAIRNGGKTEIRVGDDGHGMGREDALLSLDRHATSKIREEADLAGIRTLGFRGEALPSIAAVSRLTLETAEGGAEGTRVRVHGGAIVGIEACARGRGTTVTVRTLFFNVPARAKFLRASAVETRGVSEVLVATALARPQVALRLESNGREVLDLPPAGELRHRVADIWDEETAGEHLVLAHREGGAGVTGLVQRPHAARPGTRRSHLFVNGRPVHDPGVLRAAERGYLTTIPPGARPSLFLLLDLPDPEVDVNVHPAKAEVRFRDRKAVEAFVEEAVRAALGREESAPTIGRRSDPPSPAAGAPAGPGSGGSGLVRAPARPVRVGERQMSLFLSGASVAGEEGATPDGSGEAAAAEGGREERPGAAGRMWQLHDTYILAETRTGLLIVDQHAAHERILYEELMAALAEGRVGSQQLLFPITLRLSPAELATVTDLGGILRRAGFEIEPFGGRSVIVQAVPHPHPRFDPEACLRQMIEELTQGSELVDAARTQHQRLCLSFACHGAIKAGQRLSTDEMAELFDRLFAAELPYHDVHGRPTIVQLSLDELHHRFRRGR